jgi:predicted dehydrogenase
MELWRYGDPSRAGWQHPLGQTRRKVVPADPLLLQLQHFCRVVRGQEPPLVDGADGARTLAAALAVQESIDRQAPVLVAERTGAGAERSEAAREPQTSSPETESCN